MPERYWTIFQYALLALRRERDAGVLGWDTEFDGEPPDDGEINALVEDIGTWRLEKD